MGARLRQVWGGSCQWGLGGTHTPASGSLLPCWRDPLDPVPWAWHPLALWEPSLCPATRSATGDALVTRRCTSEREVWLGNPDPAPGSQPRIRPSAVHTSTQLVPSVGPPEPKSPPPLAPRSLSHFHSTSVMESPSGMGRGDPRAVGCPAPTDYVSRFGIAWTRPRGRSHSHHGG